MLLPAACNPAMVIEVLFWIAGDQHGEPDRQLGYCSAEAGTAVAPFAQIDNHFGHSLAVLSGIWRRGRSTMADEMLTRAPTRMNETDEGMIDR